MSDGPMHLHGVPEELFNRLIAARRPDETWEALFERLLDLEQARITRAEIVAAIDELKVFCGPDAAAELEKLKTFRGSALGGRSRGGS